MAKHTAVYLRNSEAHDRRLQERELRGRVVIQGAPAVWYRDRTIDGPALKKLLAHVAAGKIGTIIVSTLDQLGMPARDLLTLLPKLLAKGVNLVSVQDDFNLNTPTGRHLLHALALFVAYDAKVRAERIAAGQAAARAAGRKWGGSQKGRRLSVTEEQAKSVRHMKAKGMSIAAIARKSGMSRPSVYRILANGHAGTSKQFRRTVSSRSSSRPGRRRRP